METLTKIWTFFNGKKTTIGAVILFIAVFLNEVVGGIWGVDAPSLHKAIQTLNWIGMPLTAGGVFHKAVKPKG